MKKPPIWMLAAMLMACTASTAASDDSTLERGTLTTPPPPPARPGVGAPVVGQPGQFRQPLPRLPHKRVLPPSNEPGLWSGDQPRASADPDFKPGFLLGMWLPLPEPLENTDRLNYDCAAEGAAALGGQGVPELLAKLLPGDFLSDPHYFNKRHCLAARWYAGCAKRKLAERAQSSATQEAVRMVEEWMRGKCSLAGASPLELQPVLDGMNRSRLH